MARSKFKPRGFSRNKTFESRSPKYYFLIITNGESTEFNFFKDYSNSLPKGTVQLKPLFHNGSPAAVVRRATRELKNSFFDEIWAVFDKDEFQDFGDAVIKAQKSNIQVGYSNPCFELWLLLHFQNVSAGMTARQLFDKVVAQFNQFEKNFNYGKSQDKKLFEFIRAYGDEDAACHRAEKLINQVPIQPWQNNPSTSIHKLIEQVRVKTSPLDDTN